ncbi:MAG TPA: acyl-CoA thioesterase [Chitinophagaceae bacterium]|nr:acyl-CoA thioesterase [Chitinophagaceae bacterium]
MQNKKTIQNTVTTMNEIVLPNDTNTLGNLMGGKLMYWMDIAAAMAAQKHCNNIVVTASVDNISFAKPIKVGNVLKIESRVTMAFNTSMEVYLKVWGEDLLTGEKHLTNEAYLTFVAIDDEGKPVPVPEILAETDEEKEWQAGALRRRQLRLILGGKMKPEDANELRALFN